MPNFITWYNMKSKSIRNWMFVFVHSSYHLKRVFRFHWIPKNPHLNQGKTITSCQTFPPEKMPESKISHPKNHYIIPVTWNPKSSLGSQVEFLISICVSNYDTYRKRSNLINYFKLKEAWTCCSFSCTPNVRYQQFKYGLCQRQYFIIVLVPF